MQFLTSLLTGTGNGPVTYVLALAFVIILIVLGLWLLKVTMKTTGAMVRPRSRRLQVVEQVPVDGRRQLLLIRRDGVEHLILIGGAQDLLVEGGIPVDTAQPAVAPSQGPEATATRSAGSAGGKPSSRLDHLRDITRSTLTRKPVPPATPQGTLPGRFSLRHTGLLRPVSVMEPAVIPLPPMAGDNPTRPRSDSAKTGRTGENGRMESDASGRTGSGEKRPDLS